MSEEKKKYQLQRVNFTQEPILPVFSEVFQRHPWVYYGENNLMPIYLIEQFNNSSIHKACITSIVNQIVGDGVVSLNNPMASINLINNKENVNEVFAKCALDLVLFGGYSLNVIWSRDRKTIAEIYHLDFSRVRCGKINPETDEIEQYYYSADWSNIRKHPVEEYPAFSQDEREPSQIVYYKQYQPSNSYYPVPKYSGALAAISIDVQVKLFHQNNLSNNMNPSLWIDFVNGVPGEEEQRLLTRSLQEQYSSVNNAGRPIISFSESPELSPKITQIESSSNDSYYSSLYDDIIRTILSGHRISSGELFGISTANKLGSKDEIDTHIKFIRQTVVLPFQNELLPTFNKLVSLKFEKPTIFEVKPLTIYEGGDIERVSDVIEPSQKPVEASEQGIVNENIKGLKGREFQALMRIVREYNKGKITREQAKQMLMSGYGLTEVEINVWLGDDEENTID